MTDLKSTMMELPRFGAPSVATVGSARCLTYNLGGVRKAVRQCVEELPDMQERLRNSHSVLLKPNLLSSSRDPEAHVNTHPAVVQAIAEVLKAEFGCEVAIGDSTGSLGAGSTARAIQNSQMDRVALTVGASIYNVDAQPRHVVTSDDAKVFKEIPLPSTLSQFDLIISVAKLKTHQLTYVTGPVKNVFGLVPGAGKRQAHLLAPRVAEFSALLCDLYALVRPGAAFVDGVVAMEGRGPAGGSLRHVELIAASCDAVALDSFCAEVMGFDPMAIPLLAQCHERGLGVAAPGSIVVRGEPASAFALPDFAKPPAYAGALLLRMVPRWLFRRTLETFSVRYAVINQDKCRRCGECAKSCPSQAIAFSELSRLYQVERRKCIACSCCAEVCPSDAVTMRGTFAQRGVRTVSSALLRRRPPPR